MTSLVSIESKGSRTSSPNESQRFALEDVFLPGVRIAGTFSKATVGLRPIPKLSVESVNAFGLLLRRLGSTERRSQD
jgi:hypothetical protein